MAKQRKWQSIDRSSVPPGFIPTMADCTQEIAQALENQPRDIQLVFREALDQARYSQVGRILQAALNQSGKTHPTRPTVAQAMNKRARI